MARKPKSRKAAPAALLDRPLTWVFGEQPVTRLLPANPITGNPKTRPVSSVWNWVTGRSAGATRKRGTQRKTRKSA